MKCETKRDAAGLCENSSNSGTDTAPLDPAAAQSPQKWRQRLQASFIGASDQSESWRWAKEQGLSDFQIMVRGWRWHHKLTIADWFLLEEIAAQLPAEAGPGELHSYSLAQIGRRATLRRFNKLRALGVVIVKGDSLGIVEPGAALLNQLQIPTSRDSVKGNLQ